MNYFFVNSYLFRGGKQIDLLAVDENYDFEYQEVTNLGKTKTVKLVSAWSEKVTMLLSLQGFQA